MLLLPNATLVTSRWHNGAGRKADLASGDGWLAGFAWLDADAPFSVLPGMNRTITLVEGPGFTLDVAGHPLVVDRRFAPAQFDGGASTQCRIAGPSRVLNVMTDRARFTHEVAVTTSSGSLDPGATTACLLVLLSGTGSVSEGEATATLGVLDGVSLAAPAHFRLGADGCLAILTIRTLAAPSIGPDARATG